MDQGKCPKCEQYVLSAEVVDIPLTADFHPQWQGIAYVCPNASCQTILGMQINPLLIQEELVSQIAELLQGAK